MQDASNTAVLQGFTVAQQCAIATKLRVMIRLWRGAATTLQSSNSYRYTHRFAAVSYAVHRSWRYFGSSTRLAVRTHDGSGCTSRNEEECRGSRCRLTDRRGPAGAAPRTSAPSLLRGRHQRAGGGNRKATAATARARHQGPGEVPRRRRAATSRSTNT